MKRKRSDKKVLELEDIVLPFLVKFPVRVEGSVNGKVFKFDAGVSSKIVEFSVYQAIRHSSYGKYLHNED